MGGGVSQPEGAGAGSRLAAGGVGLPEKKTGGLAGGILGGITGGTGRPLEGGVGIPPENRALGCFEPSLPAGEKFHVVLAGYEYLSDDEVASHYIWDLMIPGLEIIIYRRKKLRTVPPRSWSGPCGMRATERLIPNRGREPGAFFDYAASVYDNPPRAFAFLHGHAAISWHTSCEAVFSRILLYNEALATNSATVPHLDKHMMSLTSKPHGENKGIKHVDGIGLVHGLSTAADPVKFYLSETDTAFHQLENRTKEECWAKFNSYNLFDLDKNRGNFRSQSAQFVVSWERFRAVPKDMLEEMARIFTSELMDQMVWVPEIKEPIGMGYFWSIHCFELIVYDLFPDPIPLSEQLIKNFYTSVREAQSKNSIATRSDRCQKQRTKCSPGCIKNTTELFSKLQRIDYHNRNFAKPAGD